MAPIASNVVNLYADSALGDVKATAYDPALDDDSLESHSANTPEQKSRRLPPAKPAKSQISSAAQKPRLSDSPAAPLRSAPASPAKPEALAAATASKSTAPEPAVTSSQTDSAMESVAPPAKTPNPSPNPSPNPAKIAGEDTKAAKIYVEVGTFKDESWAGSAVDKLTQLGFHAVVIHKNLLWSQSYRVQVGPYFSLPEAADARDHLAAQGFKGRVVN
jgi:cell division protein FtsN